MRHRSLLAGMLVLGACFSSKGSGTAPGPTSPALAATDYTATIADPLGFLPLDSELVLGVDGDQIRKAGLWAAIAPRLEGSPELAKFKQECGFDPTTTLHHVRTGLRVINGDQAEGVIVAGGLDRARLMACAEKMDASDQTLEVDRGVVRITTPGGPIVVMTFVDASTAVAQFSKTATRETLLAALAAGTPLRASTAFVAMLGQVDLGATLWGFANGTSTMFDQVRAMGVKPTAVFGSVKLTPGVAANLHVRLDTPDAATTLATSAQGQLGMAQAFFDKLSVVAQGSDLVVTAVMSDDQVQNLIGLMGAN